MKTPIPEYGYVSVPPYQAVCSSNTAAVAFTEWADLRAALQHALLTRAQLVACPWPTGVFVKDCHGCLVWFDHVNSPTADPNAGGTAEVFQILHELGGDTLGLLDIELESMIRQEQR